MKNRHGLTGQQIFQLAEYQEFMCPLSKVKLNIYIYQNCVNVERERAGGNEDRYIVV